MEDTSSDAHGYAKLVKPRRQKEYNNRTTFTNLSPPVDAYNAVYLAFVMGGAGFLLPYNSFIMAMDYFKVRYPGTPVVFDLSLVYICVAFLTVLANNLLLETISLNSRINFGYIMSFITLIFVVICEVWWEAFGTATSYSVNLFAVAVVSIGCTVQQSSFYGYTSMLPPKYTQAVMVGESASGVFTSTVRALTRLLINELRGSTVYFFTVSASAVATCFAMYHLIRRTDFIQFYMALCERAKTRITLEPTEDAGLIETTDVQYGVLKIQTSPPPTGSLSFANPAYEPSAATAPTYKVEDVVIRGRQSISQSGVGLASIKRGLHARWEVTKSIYPYMISICVAYFTTLSVYPGIISEVVSCSLGSWMPIYMMEIFNGADLIGKILAKNNKSWTQRRLITWSFGRLFLIPLMVLCILPKGRPFFHTEVTPFILSLILGLSNGILGSVPMIQAATKVEDRYRELTGNMMTLLYMFGLAAGSFVAYFLQNILKNRVSSYPPCSSDITHLNTTISSLITSTTTVISSTSTMMTTLTSTLSTIVDNFTQTESSR
ncbi:unnamed protein product [Brassicogethes aeneus]|uniref:Equilibrative nucleoside transporter 4 n=1 Tax=Brassicogethes aeneus TaxID=1431903 RepID=A0A9P0AP28_BRAAE|nr:unnamed protein product [Brassicogethes aeneus]